jgi:hypothetical protein
MDEVRSRRGRLFRDPSPSSGGDGTRRSNSPVTRLRRLKLEHVQPADPLRDPYVVAVLIAMAQAQRAYLLEKDLGFVESEDAVYPVRHPIS